MRRFMATALTVSLLAAVLPCAARAGAPPPPAAAMPNVTSSGRGEWTAIHVRYAYAPGLAMVLKNGATQGQPLLQVEMMSPIEQQLLGGVGRPMQVQAVVPLPDGITTVIGYDLLNELLVQSDGP
jgi:hypothetical protein